MERADRDVGRAGGRAGAASRTRRGITGDLLQDARRSQPRKALRVFALSELPGFMVTDWAERGRAEREEFVISPSCDRHGAEPNFPSW